MTPNWFRRLSASPEQPLPALSGAPTPEPESESGASSESILAPTPSIGQQDEPGLDAAGEPEAIAESMVAGESPEPSDSGDVHLETEPELMPDQPADAADPLPEDRVAGEAPEPTDEIGDGPVDDSPLEDHPREDDSREDHQPEDHPHEEEAVRRDPVDEVTAPEPPPQPEPTPHPESTQEHPADAPTEPDAPEATPTDIDEPTPAAGAHQASIGVAASAVEESRAEAMEQDEAWLTWCATVGEAVLPVLGDLHRRIPRTTSVMLCTADGFNLCAVGVEQEAVGRLAALTSSLYAVSNASATTTVRGQEKTLDYLTLVSGSSLKVLTSVPHASLGRLLLWANADDVALGVLLVGVRAAADRIRRILALADQPPLG